MNKQQIVEMLIPVIVPMVIGLAKYWIPKIPKAWLPIVAPFLGAGIDLATSQTLGAGTAWGAALGAAGVGLREIYDQTVGAEAKKRTLSNAVQPPSTPTKT